MEDILRRNQKNQIKANVRKTQKRKAYVSSRAYAGPKKSMVRSFMNFVRGIARFVRSLFKQRIPERCSRTYKYEGPARVRGAEGQRFGVVMRQRGRKYKAATRNREAQSLQDRIKNYCKAMATMNYIEAS